MKKILLAISVAMIFILTGCYIPEKFIARVDVHKDGSYTMTYDGTMINLVAWEGISNGKKNLEDEKMLQKEVNNIGKDPEVKHIEYLGSGRYRISIEKRRKAGQRGYIFGRDIKVIQAIPLKGGVLQVYVDDMKPNDIRELKSLGLKVDGKLIVSVPEGMEVLGSNADRKPSLFGLFGDYEWDINSFEKKIDIRLRPKDYQKEFKDAIKKRDIDQVEKPLKMKTDSDMILYPNAHPVANSEREELERLRAEKAMAERKELEQLRAEKAKKFVLAYETLCSSSDDVVLSCNIKQKILSICHQKDNKFVYKYGKPQKVELTISSSPIFSHNQFIRMNVESRLRFHNKGYDYIVYSNDLFTYDKHPNDGTGVYKAGHGVYVVKNNKFLSNLKCKKTYPHMKDIYKLRNSFRHEKYSFLDRR